MMTLLPGDVIATGTPSGVSKMEDGDICEVEIEGIGTLRNRVVNAKCTMQNAE
jgi:2-keto-4-pentenoate hydratase/2-oxohepta-3-ene-1,7-dioic acid hydratase in catechol pathway